MSKSSHVLIVDDEPRIRSMLRRYLSAEGFQVSEAADGDSLRATLESEVVHLVLLDLMMPGEDGLTLARHIRQRSNVPIIMLTGKGDLIDRVVGLESGADDYITKPFELREVLARIRTVMRRTQAEPIPTPTVSPAKQDDRAAMVFQEWHLDLVRRELKNPSGDLVPLTAGEFELLSAFARHPNRVLSRQQVMDLVKGPDWATFDRAVDTQVARLRKKIEIDPAAPVLLKTVRGGGYIFATSVKPG